MPYRALSNTLLFVLIPFLLKNGVFIIGYLLFYVELIFVATLVWYFGFLSKIFEFRMFSKVLYNVLGQCIVFCGFVESVGASYSLLGLCIVRRGFV